MAISLGPEYRTVGDDQVREAVKGVGFDLRLVCGFALDATASETAKEFPPGTDGGWAVTAGERKSASCPSCWSA